MAERARGRELRTTIRAIAVTIVLSFAACDGNRPPDTDPPPIVTVAPGIMPILTADDVVSIVLAGIHNSEQIVGRAVVPAQIVRLSVVRAADVPMVEPRAGRGDSVDRDDVVWVVRAFGTFTTQRGRGLIPPAVASGYFVVADRDGSVVGYGFP